MYSVDFNGCPRYRESLLIILLTNLRYFHGPDRVQSDNGDEFKKDVKKFVAVILSHFYEVVSIVIAENGTIGNKKQRLSNET